MNNKVAIVTGGSRGIGRSICEKLASKGVHLVINYTSRQEDAQETARLCKEQGVQVLLVKADVGNYEDCQNLFLEALKINGKIDILVNNAGITRDSLILRMSEKDYLDVIQTNLNGSFYCMKLAAAHMIKNRQGRIINISSVVGVKGNAGQVNYAASKAGVIGMTKSLAREIASRGITVNAVAPGMIETEMTKVLDAGVIQKLQEEIPMKRGGSPQDVANAVSFLASNDASYITGQVLCVDGGMAI